MVIALLAHAVTFNVEVKIGHVLGIRWAMCSGKPLVGTHARRKPMVEKTD